MLREERKEGGGGGGGYIENCESGRDKQFGEAVKLPSRFRFLPRAIGRKVRLATTWRSEVTEEKDKSGVKV